MREAHGAEEVCPCNSSAVTSKPCDKINGNFLSSMAGTGPCWHHTGDGPMFVTVPWGSQLGKAGKELVGQAVCFQHPSVPGIHLPQVDQGASMTKTFPTRQSSEITSVINLIHFNNDRKTLKIQTV